MVAQRLCCLLGATTVCLVAIASCTEDLSTRGASLTSREVTTLALTGLEREQAAQLVSFPIVRCITPTSAGTAVVLGPDTLIMTRHQLGKLYYEVNGVLTSLEVLESSSAPDDDWAVVRACPSVTTEAAWTEPERSIGVGQAIFLIGYWGKKELGTSPWTWSHVANLPRTIVKGRVVAPPKHLGLEELPPDEHFIYCDTPCAQLFAGLSGGAAVVWDERAARFVLIGIYCGVAYVRAEDGSLLFAAQLVRRLPPSALDRRDAPAKPRDPRPGGGVRRLKAKQCPRQILIINCSQPASGPGADRRELRLSGALRRPPWFLAGLSSAKAPRSTGFRTTARHQGGSRRGRREGMIVDSGGGSSEGRSEKILL